MSPEQPNPMITEVPGMEPYEGQMPSREVVVIPADKVTPQMRANAMFSPDNIHPGALKPMEGLGAAEKTTSEVVGSTVTGSLVELDQESVENHPSAQ